MKRTGLIRSGGLAAIVGGVAYTALSLAIPFLEPVFFVLLAIGALVATAALHALQGERYGWLGASASLSVFIGAALSLGSHLGLTEGLPWPLPEGIFMVSVGVVALGMVALGIATAAARVLPWWCGIALMVGGIGFAGPMLAASWTGFVMGLLAGLAWAVVGYGLLRAGAPLLERPSRVR